MKLIIDLDDKAYSYLAQSAKNEDVSESEIIENFINKYMIEPTERFQDFEKSPLKDEFRKNIKHYMHEDLQSMYDVIDSDEELPTDKAMLEVYKHLFHNVISSNGVFLELFEVYKNAKRRPY